MLRNVVLSIIISSLVVSCGPLDSPAEETTRDSSCYNVGKTYYFGYIEANPDDPDEMVANGTSNVYSVRNALAARKRFGGSKIVSSGGYDALTSGLSWIKSKARADDTVVIYLMTHGGATGMSVPHMTWTDLVDRTLELRAGKVVVFVNTCNAAYAVDAFNASDWRTNRQSFAVFGIVGHGETGTYYPGPPTINPMADNVVAKIRTVDTFNGLLDLPTLIKSSFRSFGLRRNPSMASTWKVGPESKIW